MYTHEDAQKLAEILTSQSALLDNIIDTQKKIHGGVIARNWMSLQVDLAALDSLSLKFSELENARNALCGESSRGIGSIIGQFPHEERAFLFNAFSNFRHKLLASKIESRSLGDYLKITCAFLQGIFESAAPNRKSKVYSKTGAIVNTAPDSLVLDTLM
ncbi:MAG: hypothetical protein Pg6C_15240 [Treponemataceae bacterium]|nr:MAG: hypothetical protein Pg6C_15240 [Treponemataceae bacterium]